MKYEKIIVHGDFKGMNRKANKVFWGIKSVTQKFLLMNRISIICNKLYGTASSCVSFKINKNLQQSN